MAPDEAVVGCTGKLVVATRGADGPGEVLVRIRGGTETFLAYSDEPLALGASVLIIESLGSRQVSVIAWGEWSDPLLEPLPDPLPDDGNSDDGAR